MMDGVINSVGGGMRYSIAFFLLLLATGFAFGEPEKKEGDDPAQNSVHRQLREFGLVLSEKTWHLKSDVELQKLVRRAESLSSSYANAQKRLGVIKSKEDVKKSKEDKKKYLDKKKKKKSKKSDIPKEKKIQAEIKARTQIAKNVQIYLKKKYEIKIGRVNEEVVKRFIAMPMRPVLRTPRRFGGSTQADEADRQKQWEFDTKFPKVRAVRADQRDVNDLFRRYAGGEIAKWIKANTPSEKKPGNRSASPLSGLGVPKGAATSQKKPKNKNVDALKKKKQYYLDKLDRLADEIAPKVDQVEKETKSIEEHQKEISKLLEGSEESLQLPLPGKLNEARDYWGDYAVIVDRLQYKSHTKYYENGRKQYETHWKNGKKDGLRTAWYPNGQKHWEGHYKNGMLVSASVWKPDGKPCPITKVVDGLGILVEYHANGQKSSEGHFKNGKEHGLITKWHANGQKESEGHYKDDEPDGLWTEWYENGQKHMEYHYKNGKKDGLWTHWHENGRKQYETHWKNGKKDGLRTAWDENGRKIMEAHWRNGSLIRTKKF